MNFNVGASLYFSEGLEKNKCYIDLYAKNNVRNIFSSLQIPEDNLEDFKKQVIEIISYTKQLNVNLYIDISPRTLKGLKLESYFELYDMGIDCLRFDFGVNNDIIAQISSKNKVMINASSCEEKDLKELARRRANFNNIIACHNFYPKKYTGLDCDFFMKKNKLMKKYNMQVYSFIPGDYIKRGPFYDGLPTLEKHRNYNLYEAIMELYKLYEINCVFVGDIMISNELLNFISALNNGVLVMEYDGFYDRLYEKLFECRNDLSEYLIRLDNTRLNYQEYPIKQNNSIFDSFMIGDVIVCNEKFNRYNGEIEIVKKEIEFDNRYNYIGKINEKYLGLLKYIDNNEKIYLINNELYKKVQ